MYKVVSNIYVYTLHSNGKSLHNTTML